MRTSPKRNFRLLEEPPPIPRPGSLDLSLLPQVRRSLKQRRSFSPTPSSIYSPVPQRKRCNSHTEKSILDAKNALDDVLAKGFSASEIKRLQSLSKMTHAHDSLQMIRMIDENDENQLVIEQNIKARTSYDFVHKQILQGEKAEPQLFEALKNDVKEHKKTLQHPVSRCLLSSYEKDRKQRKMHAKRSPSNVATNDEASVQPEGKQQHFGRKKHIVFERNDGIKHLEISGSGPRGSPSPGPSHTSSLPSVASQPKREFLTALSSSAVSEDLTAPFHLPVVISRKNKWVSVQRSSRLCSRHSRFAWSATRVGNTKQNASSQTLASTTMMNIRSSVLIKCAVSQQRRSFSACVTVYTHLKKDQQLGKKADVPPQGERVGHYLSKHDFSQKQPQSLEQTLAQREQHAKEDTVVQEHMDEPQTIESIPANQGTGRL